MLRCRIFWKKLPRVPVDQLNDGLNLYRRNEVMNVVTVIGAGRIRIGAKPVSYTHLDVYKRQDQGLDCRAEKPGPGERQRRDRPNAGFGNRCDGSGAAGAGIHFPDPVL